jgi:predicted acyl esterase
VRYETCFFLRSGDTISRERLSGDAQPLVAGEIAELTFDLLPTSYLFQPGHRIRIAIAGADASHFAILPGGPPILCVRRSRLHASRIDLPVIRP